MARAKPARRLMAQATALRERIEYRVEGQSRRSWPGFVPADNGRSISATDPIYHFASDGALRRAFLGRRSVPQPGTDSGGDSGVTNSGRSANSSGTT